MKKIVLAIKSGNPLKAAAFKGAAKNIFPNDDYIAIDFSNELDVRPLTIGQIRNAAEENARRLASSMRGYYENSFAIAIQKGTNLAEKDAPLLKCVIAIESIDSKIQFCVWSNEEVWLPFEVQAFIRDGVEIYAAYEKFYGDRWKDGKASLYELQTGKEEIDWIQAVIEKALKQLKELLKET